ncbi:type I polyketide synthase [Mycobacterium sp.]|uniref:type I polyketide synthase n=1 Tax=Mycobacterium sp. TaxID=1785 RepID=UPI003F9B8648
MTNLAERAAQLSPNARTALARELVRAGTAFPTDIAEPVAVVGIGCRFPGNVTGPESFWQLLIDGVDTITEVPPDRWDADAFYDPDPSASGRMTSKWGGFVPDVDGFDADFFGITPREAVAMDPQHRMLLEVAWEALEHAGIPPDSLSGTRTGVMMGLTSWDYTIINFERRADIDAYLSTGTPHCAAVGRISYLLGLRGPAVAVDTACSSSLVAIHLACQSLRLRESDMALAGGVGLTLSPFTAIALSKWSAQSPTGRCNSFDASADGCVRGEGCGVVVLKRLADALRDQDRVLAVVRGSATNQDGRSNGMTAPNALAQRDVITSALRLADVTADSVNYVETHGTGTILGDPIEFESLAATYGRGDGTCALGSVKTNIGHLEAAAGVAGFIKTVLAVERGHIPRNLHFTGWNPAIDASSTRLFVPTESAPWPAATGPRRGAVSSFGLSGSNAHVVIEQAPDTPDREVPATVATPHVSALTVSGKTAARVSAMAAALADWMSGPGAAAPLADVAHTLSQHRTRHAKFATVVALDRAEAIAGLRALAAGQPRVGVVDCHQHAVGPGRVFVYSGGGSHWAGMGRQLLADEPAFAKAVAELEPDFIAQTGFSLQEVLSSGEPVTGLDRIHPVLVGMQLALTELWRSYGVTPDAVIGHSMGEVSAAVVAGALNVADGLRVIATRSRLMSRLSGQGALALLELDAEATSALLADYPDVTLAVHAAPRQTVIAGPREKVHAIIEAVREQNRLARPVEADMASHHPLIDPLLPELRTLLADLTPTEPTIPILSTSREHDRAPVFDAQYWADNLRNPVRFHQAIAAAAQHHDTIVEVSPHPVVLHAVKETLDYIGAAGRVQVLPTLHRENRENLFFHTQLAAIAPPRAAKAGVAAGRLVDLPTTPWRHAPFWVAGRPDDQLPRGSHPLLGVHIELPAGDGHVWQGDVGTARHPWLADHKVHGQPTLHGPTFAEIVLAAACEGLKLPVDAVCVRRLEIEQLLPLSSETPFITRLFVNSDGTKRIEVHSRTGGNLSGASGTWVRHAVARIETVEESSASRPQLTPDAGSALSTTVSTADYYAALRHSGHQHGPAFAGLTRIARLAGGGSETEIALPEETPRNPAYRIHPVLLDSAMQGLAAALPAALTTDRADTAYLPMAFDSIRVLGEVGPTAVCRAELSGLDDADAGMLGRVSVFNESGALAAEISGVCVRRVDWRAVPVPLSQKVFDVSWVNRPAAEATAAPTDTGSWLMLADSGMTAMARDLATKFGTPNRRVVTADLHDEQAVLRAFADAAAVPELPPRGVVVFAGGAALDPVGAEALAHTEETIWSIVAAVRAVVRGWHGQPPRLWLVTGGGLVTQAGETGNPAAGALRGLVRVLAYEHPELHTTLVDLDPRGDSLATLVTELQLADSDDVVAWRGDHRRVERLNRATIGAPHRDHIVRSDGSYVVTGGLGGLGLVVARWLVDRGAGRIILNGRNAPSEATRALLDELAGPIQIEVVTGDIAQAGVADALVAAAERTGLPLRGIVHCAAVIDDGLVIMMKKESLHRVWAAKAAGALRLHHATVDRPLDWWVCFSSAAALLGSPGVAAYACANAWLDALAQWRRDSGLPATAINWGLWSDAGLGQWLRLSALDPITPAEGIEALEALLAGGATRAGVVRLRLDREAAAFPEIGDLGYFAALAEELENFDGSGDWAGPQALADLAPDEAARVVADRLRLRVLAIMGYPDDWPLEADSPLIELGMDSLMAVRIRNSARADFGVEPPVALLLHGGSLQNLTTDLVGQLGLVKPSSTERASGLGARAQQRAMARQDAVLERLRGLDP